MEIDLYKIVLMYFCTHKSNQSFFLTVIGFLIDS